MSTFSEKNIHLVFEVSVFLKGLHALMEILGGVILYFVSQQFLFTTVDFFFNAEIGEDPQDLVWQFLHQSVAHLTVGGKNFAVFYLLSHGIIKGFLVYNLLKEKLWAYPSAIVIFSLFIFYQIYRFTFTHSPWLVAITVLDLIIIGLTWHEYMYRKSHLTYDRKI